MIGDKYNGPSSGDPHIYFNLRAPDDIADRIARALQEDGYGADVPRGRPPIGDRVSLRLPPELRARVDAIVAATGLPLAEVLRRAVELGLDDVAEEQ